MKRKSAAGIVCYAKSMEQTAHFYEPIGFQIKACELHRGAAYLNWFWIDFLSHEQKERPKWKEEVTFENGLVSSYISVLNR